MNLDMAEIFIKNDSPQFSKLYKILSEFLDTEHLNSIITNLNNYNDTYLFKHLYHLKGFNNIINYIIIGCNQTHTVLKLLKFDTYIYDSTYSFFMIKEIKIIPMVQFELGLHKDYMIKELSTTPKFFNCMLCKNENNCKMQCVFGK